ncbi:SPOR domain-containing protein [Sphingomonas sp. NFR15]|uniref:SPOR domain-containing protein n=1 Tax=Sphingomonas sp. NFR15 TaxID=1566282 RepID=UPI000891C849|nr:SPOR domain-containing protein [Sphingomonas sp. NFR15]SDA19576.1 hypothetical protein SAMN03159340_01124 [Sphingomonas sp. NFR15]
MKTLILVAALATGGMALAMPARADVKAGVDAWSRGDYRKAIDEWRPAAIKGDPDAQFNLGQAYKLGRGVPVDLPIAESWYRKAAMQGHLQAEDNYGLILFDEGKRTDAVRWLERSATRGEPRAQLVFGTMLFNGDNVSKDWPRAYAFILRSAAQGQPRAPQVQAQMDQYLSPEDRQKGMVLSRQYEADEKRPQLPPEIAGAGTQTAIRGTDLPPSAYDPGARPAPLAVTPRQDGPKAPPHAAVPDAPRGRPTPPPRPQPAPTLAGNGRWRIQLGAFRDEGNARGLWQSVQGRLPGLQPYYVKSGAVTRLQAGPLASGAAATRACGAARTSCVPVAP